LVAYEEHVADLGSGPWNRPRRAGSSLALPCLRGADNEQLPFVQHEPARRPVALGCPAGGQPVPPAGAALAERPSAGISATAAPGVPAAATGAGRTDAEALGSLIGLWLTSFLAVYREGAETVLFYFALAAEAFARVTEFRTGLEGTSMTVSMRGFPDLHLQSPSIRHAKIRLTRLPYRPKLPSCA